MRLKLFLSPCLAWAALFTTASVGHAGDPLSSETLAKIQSMTALFDGSTLNGWAQSPPAPLSFSESDIVNAPALAKKLSDPTDEVAQYLATQFDSSVRKALRAPPSGAEGGKALKALLVQNLNRLAGGPSLYDPDRFQDVHLRLETTDLQRSAPRGMGAMRLNRMLLEDAFSSELAASPSSCWVVKDGALASVGAGRGVIYTNDNFSHYRLIFSVRYISGKPDHPAGVLIFCTRPPPDQKGLDALGGIQFQVPNGGHWDYRPGHNNAGDAFKNPAEPKFDSRDWSQVEILVNASQGTARMAVAQPVGTRGVENLDFSEAAAGKAGPIALQMHNPGLFDEYKDIRIEVDPAEDRLLTAQ